MSSVGFAPLSGHRFWHCALNIQWQSLDGLLSPTNLKAHTGATAVPRQCWRSLNPAKMPRLLFWSWSDAFLMSPHHHPEWGSGESGGAAQVNFNFPGSLFLLCPHHIFIISPSLGSFLSANNQRTSKWGWERECLDACKWSRKKSDVSYGEERGDSEAHAARIVPFCLQQPKLDSLLLLLSVSSLRQGRNGESLRSWHNESEQRESVWDRGRDRERKAVKV